MKYKNAFWLSLVCGITLACSPMLAQGTQQDALPPLPNGQQAGARPGLPPPPPPSLSPEQQDAQRAVPGPYRLTYTLTEMDGNKKIASHRYVVAADPDAPNSRISQQNTVQVPMGSLNGNEYISEETGILIFATLRQFSNGLQLSSNVSQKTLAGASPNSHGQLPAPEIRESKLINTVLLSEDKPVVIGQLDIPGTTHFLQVQVELTKIP